MINFPANYFYLVELTTMKNTNVIENSYGEITWKSVVAQYLCLYVKM